MAIVRVQAAPFDLGAEFAALVAGRGDIGGVGSFVGLVRASPASPVRSLTLEHYPSMTEQALGAIAAEAERRWELLGCTLIHRVGVLAVGEPIVLVLAAAAHRGAALAATAFLIDWLKTRAPLWKSETFANGATSWVDAKEADEHRATVWDTKAGDKQAGDTPA